MLEQRKIDATIKFFKDLRKNKKGIFSKEILEKEPDFLNEKEYEEYLNNLAIFIKNSSSYEVIELKNNIKLEYLHKALSLHIAKYKLDAIVSYLEHCKKTLEKKEEKICW